MSSAPDPDAQPAWRSTRSEETLVEGPAPRADRSTGRRLLWITGGLLIALIVGLYLVGYAVAGDRLPKNATVAGVPVGGLSRDAAIDKLTAELSARATAPMKLRVGERRVELDPAAAGLGIDYPASVDAAGGGRSLDPRQIVRVLTGGGKTEAVVLVEDSRLRAAVAKLAAGADREPKDAAVSYVKARVKKSAAVTGLTVRQAEATQAIEAGYLSPEPVIVPVVTAEPAVTDAEAERLIADVARPAVAAPVEVKAGRSGRFRVTPAMIASALSFPTADGAFTTKLDAKALRAAAEPAIDRLDLAQDRDATVRLVDGRPKVIPAVDGTDITAEDLAAAVSPVLTKPAAERKVSVKLSGAPASFSTEDAEKLKIKEVTGAFTTYFPYEYYRNVNISRAAQLINGTVLKPGEVFSLNKVVGERTKANGFTEGFIIQGGKFRRELGGGVSQVATTTFNAMFFAGLEDVEHRPHTLFIDRYPAGREATVAWPSLDLKFRNNTAYGVLVQAYVQKAPPGGRGSITVRMWSTKTWDRVASSQLARSNFTTGRNLTDDSPDCEPMSPVQGFDVSYSRLFYRDGAVVKRERFFWRYAPTDRVRCIR